MDHKGDTPTPAVPSLEEGVRMLMTGALGQAYQQTAGQYTIPICWITSEAGLPRVMGNGSAFLLDCGQGPFLVTARHVLEAFRRDHTARPDSVCVIGETRFDLIGRVLAEDRAFDVATLRVTADEVGHLQRYGKVVLTGSQRTWPPDPPQVGRGVFFAGFVGEGRLMLPYRGGNVVEIGWTVFVAFATADSVSPTSISMVLDHAPDGTGRPDPPTDGALRGASGAPLLTLVQGAGSLCSWRLGGIITEAREPIVKAARADCLNPDGTINAHPDPMAYRRHEGFE